MKKLLRNKKLFVFLLAVIYLAGIAVSILTIGIFPIYFQQKPGYIRHSEIIAQEHVDGLYEEFEMMQNPYSHIFITDGTGECVRSSTFDRSHGESDFMEFLKKWIPEVLNGKKIFAITPSRFTPSLLHFWTITGVPVTDNGEVKGTVFMINNIQNLPEAVLANLVYFTVIYWIAAIVLIKTGSKQIRLDELRQNYIANVTHALKTPNASIKAMAEALCDDVITDPDKQKIYYGMILQETNAQNRMVQDILELSKLQSRGMDLSKSVASSEDIFRSVLENYYVLCDCTDVSLHVSDSVRNLPPLFTNREAIQQILQLLLDNAIKFVPEGGDVWIDAAITDRQATICIKDNGIGISQEDLPHIFERFYRCNPADGVHSGSGLGLAIVKELADGLGEKVWAESKLAEGTAFYFTIRRSRHILSTPSPYSLT